MVPSGAAFVDLVTPLVGRYEGGDAEGAVHGFLALVGDRDWRGAIERTVPGGIAQAVTDAATFFVSELPAVSHWNFGPDRAGASGARFCPCSAPRRAPCSSKVMSCSTNGSRSATTRTSPGPATCSRWRPPDPSPRRSPPSVPTLITHHRCGGPRRGQATSAAVGRPMSLSIPSRERADRRVGAPATDRSGRPRHPETRFEPPRRWHGRGAPGTIVHRCRRADMGAAGQRRGAV